MVCHILKLQEIGKKHSSAFYRILIFKIGRTARTVFEAIFETTFETIFKKLFCEGILKEYERADKKILEKWSRKRD